MKRLSHSFGAWIALALLCGGGLPVLATTLKVTSQYDDSGSGTLRNIIGAASNGDIIKFDVTGTITLTNGGIGIGNNLKISGPGADSLAVSGNNSNRVFNISSTFTVNISGLTVKNGAVHGTDGAPYPGTAAGGDSGGGGILNQGTLNLTGCVLTNNSASAGTGADRDTGGGPGGSAQGGGILNQGTLNLTNCVLSGNSAVGGGGGVKLGGGASSAGGGDGGGAAIANLGTLTLTNCILSANHATGGRGGHGDNVNFGSPVTLSGGLGGNGGGGAIANQGIATLWGCTLQINSATGGDGGDAGQNGTLYSGVAGNGGIGGGGAITNQAGSITLINCTLNNNTAGGGGGGLDTTEGTGGLGSGGAIASSSYAYLTNCTMTANWARGGNDHYYGLTGDGGGGGIANFGHLELIACTLYANSASAGTFVFPRSDVYYGSAYGGNLWSQSVYADIGNTILAGGTATANTPYYNTAPFGPDVAGGVNSLGHNLVGDTSSSYTWIGSDRTGPISGTPLDPRLGPLQDNSGLTLTMALLPSSPAIDGADDTLVSTLTTDQRGCPRKSGTHVDIGAYEAGASIVLNNNDHGGSSLRQALLVARSNDTIVFGPDVTTIVLTNGELPITTNVNIIGPTSQGVAVSGNNASRVFDVYTNVTASIGNLTIRDGSATGCGWVMGGGVLNQGTLTLTNCTLWNNSVVGCNAVTPSTKGGGGLGGGAANLGTLKAIDCTLATNSATGGHGGFGLISPPLPNGDGGDASGGGLFNQGTLTIICCTVQGNSATGGPSGAGGAGGNVGVGGGGGFYQASGSSDILNTIFAVDSATTAGPDVSGAVGSSGYNLVGLTSGSSGWISSDILGQDPLLGPLQDNGGPTFTMALLSNSPAIDKGNSGYISVPHADQRGLTRPVDLPAYANAASADGADIGAYEVQLSTVYRDIGLRLFDSTATNTIAAEWPAVSALRISKNSTNYGIVLVPTNSPSASKFRIQTASGTKSLMKLQ